MKAEVDNRDKELQAALEKIDRLEAALGYALTVERMNTDSWMRGFMGMLNRVLITDGHNRRCTYDGNMFRLRSLRQDELPAETKDEP